MNVQAKRTALDNAIKQKEIPIVKDHGKVVVIDSISSESETEETKSPVNKNFLSLQAAGVNNKKSMKPLKRVSFGNA